MAGLVPPKRYTIPVHPATDRYKTLRLVVEKQRFLPKILPALQNVAFFWLHASGFHKELMYPLMQRFIARLRSNPKFENAQIDCIAWDIRNHGDSAVLNHGLLNPVQASWFDYAMDTIQVVQDVRSKGGYDAVIGVGHSLGGTVMILAEFVHPKLFDGLCLVEPLIRNEVLNNEVHDKASIVHTVLKRQDTWPDRAACKESLLKSKFWKRFHEEALENYVKYGLYDADDGTVKLKCPKEQEHMQSLEDNYNCYIAFASLKSISIPCRLIFASEPASNIIGIKDTNEVAKLSSLITVGTVSGSHMLVAETPDDLVPEIESLTERAISYKAMKNVAKL